jgi:hypothetical protein
MNKALSIALLVGGIVLIVIGVNATKSFSSDVSRFFTGSPTDKAVWMLIGGSVAAVAGLVGVMRGTTSGFGCASSRGKYCGGRTGSGRASSS